jgi:hypothetical protein
VSIGVIIATGLIIITPQFPTGERASAEKQNPPFSIWIIEVIIASVSVTALLIAINNFSKPVMFSKMPILAFVVLTIYAVFFTLAISNLPKFPFSDESPISTHLDANGIWVLSVGGVSNTTNANTNVTTDTNTDDPQDLQGLQIPMYIIIAGIFGAYIRYLYLGIPEFKSSIQKKLAEFKESERRVYYETQQYLTLLSERANEGKSELDESIKQRIEQSRKHLEEISSAKSLTERILGHGMLSFTDIPLPINRSKVETPSSSKRADSAPEVQNPSSQKIVDQYKLQPAVTKGSWQEWEEVLNSISDFEQRRFVLAFDSSGYILKTVASFHLAPLLAVSAWLLLSVGGASDWRTFALVSFAVGLTTKTIIKRVMSFVGEQFKGDDDQDTASRTETTSISADPAQAKTGQTLAVTGKGFSADSAVALYFGDNGADKNIIVNSIPTSS